MLPALSHRTCRFSPRPYDALGSGGAIFGIGIDRVLKSCLWQAKKTPLPATPAQVIRFPTLSRLLIRSWESLQIHSLAPMREHAPQLG